MLLQTTVDPYRPMYNYQECNWDRVQSTFAAISLAEKGSSFCFCFKSLCLFNCASISWLLLSQASLWSLAWSFHGAHAKSLPNTTVCSFFVSVCVCACVHLPLPLRIRVETFWISCAIYNLFFVLIIVVPVIISNGGGRNFQVCCNEAPFNLCLFYISRSGDSSMCVLLASFFWPSARSSSFTYPKYALFSLLGAWLSLLWSVCSTIWRYKAKLALPSERTLSVFILCLCLLLPSHCHSLAIVRVSSCSSFMTISQIPAPAPSDKDKEQIENGTVGNVTTNANGTITVTFTKAQYDHLMNCARIVESGSVLVLCCVF